MFLNPKLQNENLIYNVYWAYTNDKNLQFLILNFRYIQTLVSSKKLRCRTVKMYPFPNLFMLRISNFYPVQWEWFNINYRPTNITHCKIINYVHKVFLIIIVFARYTAIITTPKKKNKTNKSLKSININQSNTKVLLLTKTIKQTTNITRAAEVVS